MIKVNHSYQQLRTNSGHEIEIEIEIEYPEQDEAVECLVPNKEFSVTFDLSRFDAETLSEFFKPCMEELRVQSRIRAMAGVALFHFLPQSKRSRRRHRRLIKRLDRLVRHPESSPLYAMWKARFHRD